MTYKTLPKSDLPGLIQKWMEQGTVYAPVREGNFTEFRPLADAAQADLDYAANTRYPPKALFLPQSEVLFRVRDGQFQSTVGEDGPRVILGIHSCDARALQLLDDVFVSQDYKDPYWAARRTQTALVALGCDEPCETCFCTTVGSGPFDKRGVDAMMTEVGPDYVVDVRTSKGQALFEHLPEAPPALVDAARAVQSAASAGMRKPFEREGVPGKLNGMFGSAFWAQVQQSCLGCGVCTFLCPTCHCFDIVDEAQRGERVRNWDTCMFRLYSHEASGHNPRPSKAERTRQRVMHKYAYFPEIFDEIGCTGCGRCVRYCPVDLDIRAIIRAALAYDDVRDDAQAES